MGDDDRKAGCDVADKCFFCFPIKCGMTTLGVFHGLMSFHIWLLLSSSKESFKKKPVRPYHNFVKNKSFVNNLFVEIENLTQTNFTNIALNPYKINLMMVPQEIFPLHTSA